MKQSLKQYDYIVFKDNSVNPIIQRHIQQISGYLESVVMKNALFKNISLKCEHESDGVSTWAKVDGCTYKQCPFMCKSTVKDCVVVYKHLNP